MDEIKNGQQQPEEEAVPCTDCPQMTTEEAQSAPMEQETPAVEEEMAQAPVEEAAEQPLSAEIEPGRKVTPGKIAAALAAVVVLVAVLIALLVFGMKDQKTEDPVVTEPVVTEPAPVVATVPADGDPDNVTCKGTYTASDEDVLAHRETVVATAGGKELTNGVLQVYYWQAFQQFMGQYGAYAAYFGLDYTQPLDTQMSMEEGMTWQQYFLMVGLNEWHQIQAMVQEAEKAGYEITPEDREYLDTTMEALQTNADTYGITVEELLRSNIGPGATFEDLMIYQEDYCMGVPYYLGEVEKLVPTEQDLEAYYTAHEADYTENGITKEDVLTDVRHILLVPEGGTVDETGATVYSEEEWKACEEKAQAVLEQWLAGEKTEESFAELAGTHSVDGGSNQKGGLYENVYVGQMVPAFNDWCFDPARVTGDYGLVKTEYGYHVMYFVTSRMAWEYYSLQDWKTEQTSELMKNMVTQYPLEVRYEDILIGLVPLN